MEMTKWVLKGLRTGIVTTGYPDRDETAPGISPGQPFDKESSIDVDRCPTHALIRDGEGLSVDYRRCVHCFRCARGEEALVQWQNGYEWAVRTDLSSESLTLGKVFRTSLHIRVIDAGACGACLSEIEQLNKPYYNIHRMGFFITPTPREADVLLVSGPVTDHMRMPLEKAYEAMPTPKNVIAVGACALSGGVFGPSFISGRGVSDIIPVDVVVPGCPPPPLAIIHGLLVMVGRKPSASWPSPAWVSGDK
jgi:Ni,Fe-hydrogenase III small subunit/ferredoxin-like protein FixX